MTVHNPLPALLLTLGLAAAPAVALAQATVVQTPYKHPKALFDIYLDHLPPRWARRCTGCARS